MTAYIVGVLVLVVGLVVSVALHELGHMIPAKLFGTLVPEYFIGFGKRIWSRTVGGTEYGFKWLPLGGYVRILGMYGPAKPGVKAYRGKGRSYTAEEAAALPADVVMELKPTLAQEVREQSLEEIPPGMSDRAFYRLPAWKKLIVMVGGIFMNVVLCFVLTAVALVGIGAVQPTTTLGKVYPCINDVKKSSTCVKGPAYSAGIRAGDRVVSWNGTAIDNWDQLHKLIGASAKKGKTASVPVVVERHGRSMTFHVKPIIADDGRPYVGVMTHQTRQSLGFDAVGRVMGQMFTGTLRVVVHLPVEVYKVGYSLFSGQPRDPQGPLSVIGAGRIAGEVASYAPSKASAPDPTLADRLATLLLLLASLNMALAVFNILPLLPLDGGHILGALYEGARRTFARLRGKPDPGPADTAAMMPVAYVVIGLFAIMTIILVAADIINPVRLIGP